MRTGAALGIGLLELARAGAQTQYIGNYAFETIRRPEDEVSVQGN